MTITAINLVSIFLQGVLLAVDKFAMPKAQPSKIQEPIVFVVSLVSIGATSLDFPFYHYLLAVNVWVVLGLLLLLAIAPPLAGKIEAKLRNDSQIYTPDRFKDHLKNDMIGFVVAALFILLARWTTGFEAYTMTFKNEAAFNIVLPLTVITIFAFVRWQQVDACPDLDDRIARNEPDWGSQITAFSLRYVNQLLNVLYLILVTFTGASTILYMFAFTLDRAKRHDPLPLSWPLAIAIVGVLAFLLYACGRPSMKKHEAVYLNFLTGAPAALMVIVVWLALLERSTLRDFFALGVIVIGYATYSILVILGNRVSGQGKVQLHYYSSLAFAVALTLLAGALYIS